jgi:FkbM family methyltransferase
MKLNYVSLVHNLMIVPYLIRRRKFVWSYDRRSTAAATTRLIDFWEEIFKQSPNHLVDVGANSSGFAYWLKERWPNMHIDSFEPQPELNPIGNVHRMALGSTNETKWLNLHGPASYVSDSGDILVSIARFDSLNLPIQSPALLKVDAENLTFDVLQGFGSRLDEFAMVVVEMWNVSQVNWCFLINRLK